MFHSIFSAENKTDFVRKPVIGMIHLKGLPGTPAYEGSTKNIIAHAKEEASIYKNAGVDALIIENMHDTPYLNKIVGPEVTSTMAIVAHEIKKQTQLPCGIQILAGANKDALAVAHAAGLDFIRAEGFVFGHIADEGWLDADAGALLRYRKMIGAESVAVFTDIKKKHSAHSLTADVDIVETAKAAAFFRSDALIVTGMATGEAASMEELKALKKNTDLPVLIGSGITIDNIEDYYHLADAFIIGSWFKKNGHWANALEAQRVLDFMKQVKNLSSPS